MHIGAEEGGVERAATRAHLAYLVNDLARLRTAVVGSGCEAVEGPPLPGYQRFETRDPFGNRVEFLAAL